MWQFSKMYNSYFLVSNTVFHRNIFDQNKPPAELADLKIDVKGCYGNVWKVIHQGDWRRKVSQAPKMNWLKTRTQRGSKWAAGRSHWVLLGPGSSPWFLQNRLHIQEKQESFFIIISLKAWNLCILVHKKQYFPGQKYVFHFLSIFLNTYLSQLTKADNESHSEGV